MLYIGPTSRRAVLIKCYSMLFLLVAQSCPTLCGPRDCGPRLPCSWNSPGKSTRIGCHSLLQVRIFLTHGLNLGLLLCRQILYCLGHQGSPKRAKGAGYTPSEACLLNRKALNQGLNLQKANFATDRIGKSTPSTAVDSYGQK